MPYAFFWVIPGVWILYADISKHSLCSIFIGDVSKKNNRNEIVGVILPAYTDYDDWTEFSETSANKIQTLGNHSEERIQHICFMVYNRISHIYDCVLLSDLHYASAFLTADLSSRELGKTPSCKRNQDSCTKKRESVWGQ
jgi:hypothetical protein